MASTRDKEDETGSEIGSTGTGTPSLQESMAEPIMSTSSNGGTHMAFHVHIPAHLFPNSSYLGWEPPLAPTSEADVLSEIVGMQRGISDTSSESSSFNSIDLESFSIYRPSSKYKAGANRFAGEFAALHDLCVKRANNFYCFDGVLCDGQIKRYVQNVPFRKLSIEGYEDTSLPTVGSNIWIQSFQGAEADTGEVWYRLGTPSPEYARFHQPFLWLADFAKHFVDYLKEHEKVSLRMFRRNFFHWLLRLHGDQPSFKRWADEYGDSDFRRAVVAHSAFLLNEALQLNDSYGEHPLWGEIGPSKQDLCAVPSQPIRECKTLVTPLVYQCFKNLAFAKFLEERELALRNDELFQRPGTLASPDLRSKRNSKAPLLTQKSTANVKVGDVIKMKRDYSSDSRWTDNEEFWYAYVQRLHETESGVGLRVIWLDWPAHTTCSTMHYPFRNELFLSDHCNCDEADPIPIAEVVAITSVDFFGSPTDSNAEFFVRLRYLRDTAAFEELKQDHLEFKGLETVDGPVLEPVELRSAVRPGTTSVSARRLLRRGRDFNGEDAQQNELVYTSDFEVIPLANIDRACHVRFYTMAERDQGKIPAPYCRQGTADAFYIIFEEVADRALRELTKPYPSKLRQGFDLLEEPQLPQLRALDLFCGGGNFGRGLEEGGAIKVKWAVDIDPHAIHSYRANLADPSEVTLFLGSVNDYLGQAMDGKCFKIIARPGEVDIIIGGSPCPGFSSANGRRDEDKSLQNNSLIASFAAFVDFYRPKYALLENVPNVAECSEKNKDKNVFSQMICAFVAMGYQVQQCLLDAWTCGSPQSRTRLFISIAAPGYAPLPPPSMSHSHPPGVQSRALGKAANGLKFGERILDVTTPFRYTTFGKATSDLPPYSDARAMSIRFPDHQLPRIENADSRVQLSWIPRSPRHAALVTAKEAGFLPKACITAYPKFWNSANKSREKSKAWQRNSAETLIPTVTTKINPADAFTGRALHPVVDRCLAVLEVRRAQGYPDREVIVGLLSCQWRIIGNSVPRTVALALGMSLREAWLANGSPLATNDDGLVGRMIAVEGAADGELALPVA
ncbi:DNA methyltransferase Dim-2 [Trapelia coarctata]|nr:DNA methyltransferase Dim-2 [Trapelia coarctata]